VRPRHLLASVEWSVVRCSANYRIMEVICRREDTVQQFQAPVVPVGVRQQLVEFIKGFGTSLKRMLSTKELLLTSVLLGVVWVAVALSYYGTILFGTPVCCAYLEMFLHGTEFCIDQ
jgi:hypothetical protein